MRTFSRREVLGIVSALTAGASAGWYGLLDGEQPSPPNIVLIMADDMGCGDVGEFTPNLQRLAADAVNLTQHYAGSSMCAPARAALLTGKYPHRVGAVDVPSNRGLDRIALDERTLADYLKEAGYATGLVGKWHNGVHNMDYHPNARGFDHFVGFLNGGMDYFDWVLDYNGESVASDGRYLTDVLTEEARSFIQQHRDEPFFLFLSYNAPHIPLQAPVETIARYMETFDEPLARFYAVMEHMDRGIGQVLDTLNEAQISDSTLLLFVGDNGASFASLYGDTDRPNCGLRGAKGSVYEGGIRVPSMVRWPSGGLNGGRQVSTFTHFMDWLPTLMDIAQGPAIANLDGRNVLPILYGEETPVAPPTFWQWNRYEPVARSNMAIREGNWKLVYPPIPSTLTKDPQDQVSYEYGLTHGHEVKPIDGTLPERDLSEPQAPLLFHLVDDPGERNDLAAVYPERVQRMVASGDEWFARVHREWWIKWDMNRSE